MENHRKKSAHSTESQLIIELTVVLLRALLGATHPLILVDYRNIFHGCIQNPLDGVRKPVKLSLTSKL